MTKSRALVVGGLILAAMSTHCASVMECRVVNAGFWFEPVTFQSRTLGGALTDDEVHAIAAEARSELARAFAGLGITFSDRHDLRYRVRVVQELRDMRARWNVGVPAESRSVPGFGGQGAVSFSWLAGAAVSYAPANADRASVVHAIARGIGRSAAHEFAHLLLPKANIDDPSDIHSYEYRSAARSEQYFGELRWGRVRPLLLERIPACAE